MRKIKTANMKIGISILLFSMILTVAFGVMMFLFTGLSPQAAYETTYEAIPAEGYYTLNGENLSQLYKNGSYTLTPDNIMPIADYNQSYLEYITHKFFPYAICFCLFLFAMTLFLWFILKRIQTKSSLLIINQLNNIENIDAFSADNPALIQAYESIKQKFDDNMRDYKRLNSYLSHEQKNAIALLRTKLELSGDTAHLSGLDYLSDSIDDVLTLSETSESSVKGTVDVALVCAEVCDSYKNLQNNISFTFDENDDTEIMAKQRWIYRAVANLVSNAVKYGKGNPIEVHVQSKKRSVIVTVKDYGIGISPENQEKIFNHRYRINELNKDGYGIGLSLVSHVCDLCGGFATVESELNVGSTFYLSFPQKKFLC